MHDKLEALRRTKKTQQTTPARRSLREWCIRVTPWVLMACALIIAMLLFGERILPAARVELDSVVTLPESNDWPLTLAGSESGTRNAFAGTALFQASGWFEADPYPFRATALASGVVEEVHVLEGQAVSAGDPIAILIQDDLELQRQSAQASVVAARAALEETRSGHALAGARAASMRQQIEVAIARRNELADIDERARELGPQVMAQQDIVQAELRLKTQDQSIALLEAQLTERLIEIDSIALKISFMESALDRAEVELKEAELAFDRTVIRSPVDGIIQRLLVAPGQKKVLMSDNPESATVALLFQPENLQARIDVPLADASRLRIGQAVLLESEFLPGMELQGHVQRISGEADLQRNTLQAKVAIINPPPGLRPEILCRARFLDTSVTTAGTDPNAFSERLAQPGEGSGLQVLIPRSSLIEGTTGKPAVWVVDASGNRIERRSIKLAGEPRGEYYPVGEGLRPGDRIVVRPDKSLREGTRIKYD